MSQLSLRSSSSNYREAPSRVDQPSSALSRSIARLTHSQSNSAPPSRTEPIARRTRSSVTMNSVSVEMVSNIPKLFDESMLSLAFNWKLSKQSPDWYARGQDDGDGDISLSPPFCLRYVQAGSRHGWSWLTSDGLHYCDINWLDPEPNNDAAYTAEIQRIEQRINFYGIYFSRNYRRTDHTNEAAYMAEIQRIERHYVDFCAYSYQRTAFFRGFYQPPQ